jgi:hypothetical protein
MENTQMNHVNENKLAERHSAMLKYQKDIAPFTPTIRELEKLWRLNTTSAAHLTMDHLVSSGRAIFRKCGKTVKYFAVEVKA